MKRQHHTHGSRPGRPGGKQAKPWWRWWAVGVTGLALTAAGIAAIPLSEAIGPTAGAPGTPTDRAPSADSRRDAGKDDRSRDETRQGAPVPCDTDRLIAEIALANAGGGAVLDLAEGCTYLLTADLGGAGLPAITVPITLNGGQNTAIERAAAVDQFRILTVGAGGDLTLNHLTVTGGHTAEGGGILVDAGGALTTNHSVVSRNVASILGGGIANSGTVRIRHSSIARNIGSQRGGGIFSSGPLEIVESHIDRNTSDLGGGIFESDSSVTVKGGSIADNWAQAVGGLFVSGGIGAVAGTRIVGNSANSDGGGVRVGLGGQLTLQWVRLTDNAALSGLGGGLFVEGDIGGGSFVVVEDSVIKNNTAVAAAGGGIFNAGQTVVRRTRVLGNRADRGGGIHNSGTVGLAASKVVDNVAVTDGGGIANDGGTVHLNPATGTLVIKNRPKNCVGVPGCSG